jgi:hypothetical protein
MSNLLEELCALLDGLQIPNYTADFPDQPPQVYCVLVPIADSFPLQGDGAPLDEISEFVSGNAEAVTAGESDDTLALINGQTAAGHRQ